LIFVIYRTLDSSFNILVENKYAKDFMENILSKDYFLKLKDTSDIPF